MERREGKTEEGYGLREVARVDLDGGEEGLLEEVRQGGGHGARLRQQNRTDDLGGRVRVGVEGDLEAQEGRLG